MAHSRFKNAVKRGIKSGAALLNGVLPSQGSAVRILTYHSVGDRDHEMNVTCEQFAAQMRWLQEHANVLPVGDAARGKPGIAITFDDGYLDNLINAAPILAEFSFPATVYMVAGMAGGHLGHDAIAENTRLMSWDELRTLESAGVTIGAHSMTHARLSTLSSDVQRIEIVECARRLEQELRHSIESFAYPYGSALDYNDESIRLVQEAGFQHAVSNRYGSVLPKSSKWALPRIWIDGTDSVESFALKASGGLDILSLQDSYIGIRSRRVLNRILRV